ncbi:MAG: amino acid transport protein [Planctomycetota bacterium]
MATGTIIAGFIISTLGFSFFLYGKKQRRVPQLVVGMLLMVAPFVVTNPLWMSVTAILLLAGLHIALRYE